MVVVGHISRARATSEVDIKKGVEAAQAFQNKAKA